MGWVHYTSTVEVRRPTVTSEHGIPKIGHEVVDRGEARVDLLHLHDPGDAIMIREAGTTPDRVGTIFFPGYMNVKAGDIVIVVGGNFLGVSLTVEVDPTESHLGRGVVHKEARVRELNTVVAGGFQ